MLVVFARRLAERLESCDEKKREGNVSASDYRRERLKEAATDLIMMCVH